MTDIYLDHKSPVRVWTMPVASPVVTSPVTRKTLDGVLVNPSFLYKYFWSGYSGIF